MYNSSCEINVCVSDYLKASFLRDRSHLDEEQDVCVWLSAGQL